MKDVIARVKNRVQLLDKQSLNVVWNVLFAFIIQGGAMLVSLFTMPAYYKYFNDNIVLGCWFTILSLLNNILTFDLGIGNGLRNKLTEALARKDYEKGKRMISSAYFFLGPIIILVILLSWFLFPHVDWNSFFNIGKELVPQDTLLLCVRIVFSGVMLQFVLKLVSSCLYALQKSSIVNFLSLISNVGILFFVMGYAGKDVSNNLIMLSIVHVLAVNIPLLFTTLIIFLKPLRKCSPCLKNFLLSDAIGIFKMGVSFFVLQIAFMLVTSVNEFLITQFASPQFVPEYQVYYKIFNFICSICMLALTPVWSSVTKAYAQEKYEWIIRIYSFFKYIVAGVFLLQMAIIPFMQVAVNIWLGENAITVQAGIAVCFALANGMIMWNNVNSVIANGLGYLKPQFMFLTLAAILKIPVSYFFYRVTGEWYMIILASFVVMIPVNVCQPMMLTKYLKMKVKD